jgi:hypothetical protein
MERCIGRRRRVGSSALRAVGPDLRQRTKDPGILSSIVRVWTEITPPGQEAPKGRAISAASAEVLSEEIRRELRRGSDPETLHAHPPEVRVIKVYPGLVAGCRQGAGSKGEDPEVEALEDRPEVVSVAVELLEASDIRSNLN